MSYTDTRGNDDIRSRIHDDVSTPIHRYDRMEDEMRSERERAEEAEADVEKLQGELSEVTDRNNHARGAIDSFAWSIGRLTVLQQRFETGYESKPSYLDEVRSIVTELERAVAEWMASPN